MLTVIVVLPGFLKPSPSVPRTIDSTGDITGFGEVLRGSKLGVRHDQCAMLLILILLNLTTVNVLFNAFSTIREGNIVVSQGICALFSSGRVGKTMAANVIVPGYTAKMICV
jgi:hypothetical protein